MPRFSVNDSVHIYMSDLTSRVVAKSGIPTDRYHLGKIILQSLKEDPKLVLQTDGATGESETSASVLERSIRCAVSMKNLGLVRGDVMVLMAPNNLDVAISFYAALYIGVSVAAIDRGMALNELQATFSNMAPKLILCQSERVPDIQLILDKLELNCKIVTFDKGYLTFNNFLDKHSEDVAIEEFKTEDFDPADTIAFLIATSGTTDLSKSTAATHKNIAISTPYLWSMHRQFPTPTRLSMLSSPLQWLSSIGIIVTSALLRFPRLQSSLPVTPEHARFLINTYRPSFAILNPKTITSLLNPGDRDPCDFSCFDLIMFAGDVIPSEVLDQIKAGAPNTDVVNGYGMTEVTSIAFHGDNALPSSCGKHIGCLEYRLVNLETMEDIDEPNVPGELWLRGPGVFKGYYKKPKATKEAFAEDRWFKTGDVFYRDENFNYFFVERIQLYLKFKDQKVSPIEVESVIRRHPGVLDVALTSVPDPECNELPVAFVVPDPERMPTAQEIKDLVKDTLSDHKQLRGGVIFVTEIPLTASAKAHRRKLKEMALTLKRE